jgi:hypothetical protein
VVLFAVLLLGIPVLLVELLDWRYPLLFWTVLFAGSGILKLLGLGF